MHTFPFPFQRASLTLSVAICLRRFYQNKYRLSILCQRVKQIVLSIETECFNEVKRLVSIRQNDLFHAIETNRFAES